MKIDTKQEISLDEQVDVYVVPVFEDGSINSLFQKPDSFDFTGKSGQNFWLHGEKPKRIVYIGLGKSSEVNLWSFTSSHNCFLFALNATLVGFSSTSSAINV